MHPFVHPIAVAKGQVPLAAQPSAPTKPAKLSSFLPPDARPARRHSVGARTAAAVLGAVAALLAVAPAQAQTVTIEKISGKESFDAGATTRTVGSLTDIESTAHFRVRARGSDAPFQQFTGDRGEYAGITIGVEFDYQGRDLESWRNSNYTTHPGNKVSRFEVVLARTWEASGSVAGNRIWDVAERDMGYANLHLIGPVIVRLYDPPGGRTYRLGSDREICLVINQSDGTAGEPCSSSQRRSVELPRLTASFDSLPDSHDGQTAFSFRILFSEAIDATVDGMRDHALNISGGTVTGAARVNKRDDLWSFTITPSGDARVEIILAGGASCTADGAICTSDGRQLSSGLLTFVSGPLPTLSIGDAVAYEGVDEHMTFMVSMDRAVTERSWFNYATADGTAEAGSDYTAKSGQLYYLGPDDTGNKGNEGEFKNWLIEVPIIDDTVEDDGETFTVTLSAPKGVTIGRGVATGTIRNSEDPVEISIADAEATEGEDQLMRFRLSLNHIARDVSVDYATADGTATAGVDYTATSGSVVLRKGTINTEIAVPVLNDAVADDGETFTLTLSNVSGAEIADGEAVGTIRDGEAASTVSTVSTGPLWSADMAVVDFGNGSIGAWGADKFSNIGGTGDLEAKWLWYHTGDRKLHLAFTTAIADTTGLLLYMGDVAVAFPDGGNDSSFSWTDVDIAWTDGETIPVRIARGGPVVVPANTAPTGLPTISGTPQVGETLTAAVAEIADADGIADATFAYQWVSNDGIADAEIAGATNSAYTLVAADSGKTIKVRVTFTDGGGTEESLTSAATATVADRSDLSVADAEASEEQNATLDFVITLRPAAIVTVTVDYATADDTATAGSDYTAISGTLTFQPGDTSKTVSVPITNDSLDDGGETLTLTLSSASGADLDDAEATGTIRNTEPSKLSVADAEASEEEDATLDFVVTLDPAATATVTVDYATADGTATAGSDYTATSGTLTFQPGDTSKTVSVPITNDSLDDGGETLTLTLSGASGADLDDAEATGTIRNTEPSKLSVADAEASEEEDATLDFVVTLDPAATATVTVDYATADGTATAGSDYTATSGTLTFQPGDTSKTVSVPITNDSLDDGGETLTLTLSGASGADLDDAEATGTIRNTEPSKLSVADAEASEEEDATLDFVVTLDPAATATVTVDYATADGTATAGSDYTATSGTLTFQPGDTSKTVSVPITNDSVDDGGETLTLILSSASGADLDDAVATGTIRNTELVPLTASFENVPAEHDGSTVFTFRLRFSEDPAVSYKVLRDKAFSVSGGKVEKARRVDGRHDLREIHVKPKTTGEIRIDLPATSDCEAANAICTADDRPLSHSLSTTVQGPGSEQSGFPLDPENSSPSGIWSDGETAWVADIEDARLFAYQRSDGERQPEKDIDTEAAPMGLWSDGKTVWVAGLGGGLRAHRLSDGARLATRDLALEENAAPAGVWSDGETAWVAQWLGDTVRAYRLSDGQRVAGRDIKLAGGNLLPGGVWSDGETLWVADWRKRMYAYRLSDGEREPGRDIDSKAADADPTGLWSSGGTLLSTSWEDGEVRTFRLPTASPRATVAGQDGAPAAGLLTFADPVLRAAVAVALGKEPGDAVTADDVAGLEVLNARNGGIRDLSGLEALVSLKELDLGFNPVADLQPLAALPELESLNLDGAAPKLQTLTAVPSLKRLSLRQNGIDDLQPLAPLTGLNELDVGDNRIGDLQPLAGLFNLTVLRADRNRIADLSPLASLAGLEALDLGANQVRDLHPLVSMTQLRTLRLGGNGLTNLYPLSGLEGLTELGLADNAIDDLGALPNLGGLRRLDLSGNAVSDLQPLRTMPSLVWVNVSGSPIKDLAPLDSLPGLTVAGPDDRESRSVLGEPSGSASQQ